MSQEDDSQEREEYIFKVIVVGKKMIINHPKNNFPHSKIVNNILLNKKGKQVLGKRYFSFFIFYIKN